MGRTLRLLGRYWCGNHVRPEDYDALAKYDVLILDCEAGRDPTPFAELRKRNPRLVILAYAIPTMSYTDLSDPGFVLRRKLDGGLGDTYAVRKADGTPLTQYQGATWLMDITQQAWRDRVVAWCVDSVLHGGLWDGLYLDTMGETVRWRDANIAPQITNDAWHHGMTLLAYALRAAVGETPIIMANGYVTQRASYNGVLIEKYPEWNGDHGTQAVGVLRQWRARHFGGGMGCSAVQAYTPLSAPDLALLEYARCTAIVLDALFNEDFEYTNGENKPRYKPWYDEDLGKPIGGVVQMGDHVIGRVFERAVVLVDPVRHRGKVIPR